MYFKLLVSVAVTLVSLSFGSPITTCSLPSDADIVPVGANGWAMSPDEPCIPGKYCPYACPPGKVMNQWDQDRKSVV